MREVEGNRALIVLVGNKVDLLEKREVSFEEGQQKSREI